MNIVFGIFVALHGVVHLLYFGHTARYFELKPGLTWPDGSWVFSHWLGDGSVRFLVSVLLVLAGCGFIASGIGVLASQAWWRPAIIAISILSSLIFIVFWNGRMLNLDGQGLIGVLINVWLLVMVVLVHWPKVAF
ncbi:MAG TPA: hypothetical protein VLD65_00070 [Anaerolineales bacterium]|nr:hypothetical protein [Anaerolineales bacterium]